MHDHRPGPSRIAMYGGVGLVVAAAAAEEQAHEAAQSSSGDRHDWAIVLTLLTACVVAVLPGAILASLLGQTRVAIPSRTISIALASFALVAGLV